jgi:hypothetical protein
MSGTRVILATALMTLTSVVANAQTTLYVNGSTGNDSTSRAANSAASPWRTIGRAVWGSANRSTPNAGEAAAAGHTVNVAGGTYSFTGTVGNRFDPVYNPVNNGTAGSYITITCTGRCTLVAPSADSPVIGASAKNYIKWFADVGAGNAWVIQACGTQSGCGAGVVNTTPDTGPVVCHGATGCWIEGASIDGGAGIDYADNWNAVRIENCTSCVVRNISAANFTRAGGSNHNQSIITMYGSRNSIIEHNVGRNSGAGVYFKDSTNTNPQSGNLVRFNRFDAVNEVIAFSLTSENRNYIYQNVGMNGNVGLAVVGGGLSNDWIFNNTFYRMALAAVVINGAGTGGRFWNNICVQCDTVVLASQGAMPSEAVFDMEHNVYSAYGQFYQGSDGARSFASFKSSYAGQEQAAPASVDANPLFVNAATGDFRLGGSSPAIGRGVDLHDLNGNGSTTDTISAGAHVTGAEVIGPQGGLPNPPTAPAAPTAVRVVR